MKPTKQQLNLKQTIIDWFKMVQKGIEGSYELGWSHRKPRKDINMLNKLLDQLIETAYAQKSNYQNTRNRT